MSACQARDCELFPYPDLYVDVFCVSLVNCCITCVQGWALAAHPGEITYDLIKAYHVGATSNSTTFVDDMIVKAFADRKGARALSLINVLVNFKYGFHEIDVSLRRTKANNESTNPLTGKHLMLHPLLRTLA